MKSLILAFVTILTAATSFAFPNDYPKPECKSAYGSTVCGYHCTAGYGDVKCSKYPSGACGSGYGVVKCWDPDRDYYPATAECASAYGEVACGFNCATGYGEVKCAQHPWGICKAEYGEIKCYNDGDESAR